MTMQLFQQFISLLKQSSAGEDFDGITTYDQLVDQIFNQVEGNLQFFAHRVDQLISLHYQLLQTYQAEGTTLRVCSNMYDIFVLLVERRPVLITKNQNRLHLLIQKLYEMSILIDYQCDEAWMKPYQGYIEENDFSDDAILSKQIMIHFDKIAHAYTYPLFHQFFCKILPSWWESSQNNWKARYSLLLLMSQLGEDCQNPLTIKTIIECGKKSLVHHHPKVRYGALQMFGQIASNMKQGFQETYSEQLFPLIIGCTKDQVPRVQGHAMGCLLNILQNFEPESYHILQPYANEILNLSQIFCYNGISIVKQNTISTIATLGSLDILNEQQIQRILSIINNLLTSQLHQKPQYRQLMNQTCQCLSMILYGQKNENGQKILTQSITILKSLRDRIAPSYFVGFWNRICLKYKNFTDLGDIFPYILQQVANMVQINAYEVQDAVTSINNTITAFSQNIKPYASIIFELCKNSLDKIPKSDENLRPLFYDIMVILVMKLKSQAPDPQWQQLSKLTFTYLYEQVQRIINDYDDGSNQFTGLQQSMQSLKDLIKYVNNLFTAQNATKFAQNIFNFSNKLTQLILLTNSDLAHNKQSLQLLTDDIQKEQMQEYIDSDQGKLSKLYQARLVIPDIFQSILSVVSLDIAKSIMESLYPYISPYLQSNVSFQDIRYGLYFLCDFLAAVKYQGIQQHATVYQSKFTQFSLSTNLQVRNCAVFGLGEFMKFIPIQKTDETLIYKWLNILWNSLSLSLEDQTDKKKFGFARDNIVSALGKFIYSKRSYYSFALNKEVHNKWFENLPLNFDKDEGNIQHEILLNLLEQSPQQFISTKQDVFVLLGNFAKYFAKRMNKNDELVLKNKTQTKNFLFKMKDWPIFQQNSDFLWNNLPMNQKNILTQLMSAP